MGIVVVFGLAIAAFLMDESDGLERRVDAAPCLVALLTETRRIEMKGSKI